MRYLRVILMRSIYYDPLSTVLKSPIHHKFTTVYSLNYDELFSIYFQTIYSNCPILKWHQPVIFVKINNFLK